MVQSWGVGVLDCEQQPHEKIRRGDSLPTPLLLSPNPTHRFNHQYYHDPRHKQQIKASCEPLGQQRALRLALVVDAIEADDVLQERGQVGVDRGVAGDLP